MRETNPLVERVDALLKRHQQRIGTVAPVDAPPQADRPQTAPPDAAPNVPVTATVPEFAPAPESESESESESELEPEPVALRLAQEADDDIPLLTEVVAPQAAPATPSDRAFVAGIENAVLERLLTELDRSLETRLNRTIAQAVEQVMDGMQAELSARVRHLVRDAVAVALAKEIATHIPPDC